MAPKRHATHQSLSMSLSGLYAFVASLPWLLLSAVASVVERYQLLHSSAALPGLVSLLGLKLRWQYLTSKPDTITFSLLPFLFRPGQVVVLSMGHGEDIGAIVRSFAYMTDDNAKIKYTIESWSYTYDSRSKSYARQTNVSEISAFFGEKPISDLCVSAMDEATKREFAARGHLHQQYTTGIHQVEVTGPFKEPLNAGGYHKRLLQDERVVLHEAGYARFFSVDTINSPRFPKLSREKLAGSEMNELQLACISPWIGGYLISHRTWGYAKVDCLSLHKPDVSSFDRVLLDSNQKALLRGIAEQARNAPIKTQYDAATPARILLFVGKPGSGKTTLAKAMADLSGRPLVPVTGAELARATANTAESTLADHLLSMRTFGGQLLLEDCELAFESPGQPHGPGTPNLPAVAKVQAVLEEIMKAGGVAYLTSRRPESIDPSAFGSITLTVRLGEPEGENRKQLWSRLLTEAGIEVTSGSKVNGIVSELEHKQPRPSIDIDILDKLVAGEGLGPRAMHDLLDAARGIASDSEGGELRLSHFASALKVSKQSRDELRHAIEAHESGGRHLYI